MYKYKIDKIMKTVKILSVFFIMSIFSLFTMHVNGQDIASKEVVYKSDVKGSTCAAKVTEALMQEKGIENTTVDLETKTIKVKYNPESTSKATIQKTINEAGYAANETKQYEGKASTCCKETKIKKKNCCDK